MYTGICHVAIDALGLDIDTWATALRQDSTHQPASLTDSTNKKNIEGRQC